jgi:hypothetical protein
MFSPIVFIVDLINRTAEENRGNKKNKKGFA